MIRNFWVSTVAEGGREVTAGPRGKSGGVLTRVLVRSEGASVEALVIEGEALGDDITLRVYDPRGGGREIANLRFKR